MEEDNDMCHCVRVGILFVFPSSSLTFPQLCGDKLDHNVLQRRRSNRQRICTGVWRLAFSESSPGGNVPVWVVDRSRHIDAFGRGLC
jgi:hypothetical protein